MKFNLFIRLQAVMDSWLLKPSVLQYPLAAEQYSDFTLDSVQVFVPLKGRTHIFWQIIDGDELARIRCHGLPGRHSHQLESFLGFSRRAVWQVTFFVGHSVAARLEGHKELFHSVGVVFSRFTGFPKQ